jgi:hypothetical protein
VKSGRNYIIFHLCHVADFTCDQIFNKTHTTSIAIMRHYVHVSGKPDDGNMIPETSSK